MYIKMLGNTNYNNGFGMSNITTKPNTKKLQHEIISTIQTKDNKVVDVAMDKIYDYIKFKVERSKRLSEQSNKTKQDEKEKIEPSSLIKRIKAKEDKKAIIKDIFKVDWNDQNVQILKEIDKLMKRAKNRRSEINDTEWYGTNEEILKKALKENMHYLVLLDDDLRLDKECDQKLLLDFINNNDWSDANAHYLTKIADLHADCAFSSDKEIWDGKTLFEKCLADKNIYLLELSKHFNFFHTEKAEEYFSQIEDKELRKKFIEKARVRFGGVIFGLSECRTPEELKEAFDKHSNQLDSYFWKNNYHGALLYDKFLDYAKSIKMYNYFVKYLIFYLPNVVCDSRFSLMDLRVYRFIEKSLPEETFDKFCEGKGGYTYEEKEMLIETFRKVQNIFSEKDLEKLKIMQYHIYDDDEED